MILYNGECERGSWMIRIFPKDFVFGAATSAFQVEGGAREGGRGACCWDVFLQRPDKGFAGEEASDFFHRYREDIECSREFNLQALTISIAWPRIFPAPDGRVNEAGLQYYSDLIDTCLKNGIEPYVVLYHFDTPLYLFQKGDWLAQETAEAFLQYARVCFERFGSRVRHWITLKDPFTLASGQYITGLFPPNEKFAVSKAVEMMHRMMLAHSRAVRLYKSMKLPGKIGIAHRLEAAYPIKWQPANTLAADLEDTLANEFLLDATLAGGYRRETLRKINRILRYEGRSFVPNEAELEVLAEAAGLTDFLGVNYYSSHFIEYYDGENKVVHNAQGKKGTSTFAIRGIGRRIHKAEVPSTDWDWSIFPSGLYDMLLRIRDNYPAKPIFITENGIGIHEQLQDGSVQDDRRIDYIRQHLNAVLDAMDEGVEVKGYFIWSLMDALSWTNGYEKRYGLFYVDYETQQRYPKKSMYWYKDLAAKRIMLTVNAIQTKGVD